MKSLEISFRKKALAVGLLSIFGLHGTAYADSNIKVLDWSGYEDSGFFASYVAKYGEDPQYSFFADEEEAFTKIRAGFDADLAHPCIGSVQKWTDAGLIKPLDTSRIKDWDKILPSIKNIKSIMQDGKVMMLPFDWGNEGLIYRTDKISSDTISINTMVDPRYQGQLSLPDIVTSAYGLASLAIGMRDWSEMTEEQFDQASAWLRKAHKNVRFYWSDPGQLDQALTSGEVLMGWGWNGTVQNLQANNTDVVMMQDTDKGLSTWVCGYVQLNNGKASDDEVYDMLNSLASTESGKYLIEAWGYAHANTEAYTAADQEIVKGYGYEDPEKFIKGTLVTGVLPQSIETKMIKEFERIKAGF